jgi:CubicO group peptidase (beta-lactamase class C family)
VGHLLVIKLLISAICVGPTPVTLVLDQARFGLLFLNYGKWKNQQLISSDWIKQATTSSNANESYGYMWWLNKGQRKLPHVDDPTNLYAAGFGGNFIVIDQKNDVMLVTRWLEPSKVGEMMKLVVESY